MSNELHPRMKKYVEDGEDEKVGEWLDGGIREVKAERQEGVNGAQGETERYKLRACHQLCLRLRNRHGRGPSSQIQVLY